MSGAQLAVVVLATYRISLLVTHDTLTEGAVGATVRWLNRRKHPDVATDAPAPVQLDVLVRRARSPHLGVKLMDCPWCVSFWIGLAVAGTGWTWGDRWWWFVPAAALAASGVTGILTDLAHPTGRTDDPPPQL